jgi:hypothetical protein
MPAIEEVMAFLIEPSWASEFNSLHLSGQAASVRPTLAAFLFLRLGLGTQIFIGKNQGAISVRKMHQIEVAYNYTFLRENLGYSEQTTEIRDQGSGLQASKNHSPGDPRTLWLLQMQCMYMKGMGINADRGLERAVGGAE